MIEIDVASGARRTLAGGDGSIGDLSGIAIDADRGRLYVADPGDTCRSSRSISPAAPRRRWPTCRSASISSTSTLRCPATCCSSPTTTPGRATRIHVVDTTASEPVAELYAGVLQDLPPGSDGDGGPARLAQLNNPEGIAVDSAGKLLISERDSGRVRVVGTSDIRPGAFPNVIRASSGARVGRRGAEQPAVRRRAARGRDA